MHTSLSGVLPRQLTGSNGLTSSCCVLMTLDRPEFDLPSYPPVRNKLHGPTHPALHACALLHVIALLAVMTFRCSRCRQSYQ